MSLTPDLVADEVDRESRKPRSSIRIPRLDGVRAFAVLMVIASHALRFTPGWMGVDIFFVLSGYLITAVLRRDREQKRFWTPFYFRRVTRILPPLLICFALAAFLSDFPWHKLGIYYFLFAANIAEARYPHQGLELSVLWSLAVEEHFYLLWPFAIRFLQRRSLIVLIVAILIAEPVVRGVFTSHIQDWWPMYILTPFRLDGLAAGSLLAILLEKSQWNLRLSRIAGWCFVTLLAVLLAASFFHSFDRESNSLLFNMFGYSLVAAVSTSLVAYVVLNPATMPSRLLTNSFVAYLGLISYGLYLYHELALKVVQLYADRIHFHHLRVLSPIAMLILIAFSWASFRFCEKPIMQWGHRKAARLNLQEQPAYTASI